MTAPAFQRGDRVKTPMGEGEIVDIEYGDYFVWLDDTDGGDPRNRYWSEDQLALPFAAVTALEIEGERLPNPFTIPLRIRKRVT